MYGTFRPGQSRWNHTTPNTRSWLPPTRVSCGLLEGEWSCLSSDPCTEVGQSSVWPGQSSVWPVDSSPCSGGPDASPRSCHLNSPPFCSSPIKLETSNWEGILPEIVATSQALSTDRPVFKLRPAYFLAGGDHWEVTETSPHNESSCLWRLDEIYYYILLTVIITQHKLLLLVHSFSKSWIYNNLAKSLFVPSIRWEDTWRWQRGWY